jgi:GTP-binding protein
MKFSFSRAQFFASAYEPSSFPILKNKNGEPRMEIACVGRSNVGKSSLINHLLRSQNLAKISSLPGKTQCINFFTVDDDIAIVDLPGYGFAKVSKQIKNHWGQNIETYLATRTSLSLILFLLDIRHAPTEEDHAFINWALFHQKPFLIIFTKADKITPNFRETNVQAFLNSLKHDSSKKTQLDHMYFSIKDSSSRNMLIKKINEMLRGNSS